MTINIHRLNRGNKMKFDITIKGTRLGEKYEKLFTINAPNEVRAFEWAEMQGKALKLTKMKMNVTEHKKTAPAPQEKEKDIKEKGRETGATNGA